MIIPELPSYLSKLGGEEYKGLIISLFTLTAGLSRPFSGRLADTIGRIPVMIIGAAFSFLCALLYPLLTTVGAFLLLRLFHGFSTGFKPTGTSAFVADIVPDDRRGEAMGLLGFFSSIGTALGPTIGGYIAIYSTDFMFYLSSFLSILSVLILFKMQETLKNRRSFSPGLLKIPLRDVLEPRVFRPSFAILFSVFSFGIVLTITPDLSEHLDITNKGLFFFYFTMASISVRLFAGRASDKIGRIPVLIFATLLLTGSQVLFGFVNSKTDLILSAVLFGLGVGMTIPALFAWTIDLSHIDYRGKAMATMYIALEVGIGSGAFLSALVYNNNPARFAYSYWLGAFTSSVAFVFAIIQMIKNHRQKATISQ